MSETAFEGLDFTPPALHPEETLPVPLLADDHWCRMVNAMYGGHGYQTQLMAEHYWLGRVDMASRVVPGRFLLTELRNYDGEDEAHLFSGVLQSVEMRPDLRPRFSHGPIKKTPYAKIEQAVDLDEGRNLCLAAGQIAVLPLAKVHVLNLERR